MRLFVKLAVAYYAYKWLTYLRFFLGFDASYSSGSSSMLPVCYLFSLPNIFGYQVGVDSVVAPGVWFRLGWYGRYCRGRFTWLRGVSNGITYSSARLFPTGAVVVRRGYRSSGSKDRSTWSYYRVWSSSYYR